MCNGGALAALKAARSCISIFRCFAKSYCPAAAAAAALPVNLYLRKRSLSLSIMYVLQPENLKEQY